MLDPALARQLKDSGKALWANLDPNQVDGWDGGLGRHALDGVSAGGEAVTTTTKLDFSKVVRKAKPIYLPEEGTDVEQAAMQFHAKAEHPSFALVPGSQPVAKRSAPTVPCPRPVRRSTSLAWMTAASA